MGATIEMLPYSYAFTDDINIIHQENADNINLGLSYLLNSFFNSLKLVLVNTFINIDGTNTVIIV